MNTKPQILLVSGGEETGLKDILRRRASLAKPGAFRRWSGSWGSGTLT